MGMNMIPLYPALTSQDERYRLSVENKSVHVNCHQKVAKHNKIKVRLVVVCLPLLKTNNPNVRKATALISGAIEYALIF